MTAKPPARRAAVRRQVPMRVVDDWLDAARAALSEDFASLIDLEAGLADALLPAVRAASSEDFALLVDVEAGLALIVPPRAARLAPPVSVPADESGPPGSGENQELRPIAGLLALPAEARLRLRATQALDALAGVFDTLAVLAEAHELADCSELAAPTARVLARILDLAHVQVLTHDHTGRAGPALTWAHNLAHDLEADLGAGRTADQLTRSLAEDLVSTAIRIRPDRDLGCDFDSDLMLVRVLARSLAGLIATQGENDPRLAGDLAHPLGLARIRLLTHDLSQVRGHTQHLAPDLVEALDLVIVSDFLARRAGAHEADIDTDEASALAWRSFFPHDGWGPGPWPTPRGEAFLPLPTAKSPFRAPVSQRPAELPSGPMAADVRDALVARSCLAALTRLRDDFTGEDLRHADIDGLHLDGVRWSQLTTRWPADRIPEIERRSTPFHPTRPDLLVIRSGNIDAHDPALR